MNYASSVCIKVNGCDTVFNELVDPSVRNSLKQI